MTNDGIRTDGPPTETPAGSATGPAQPMMLVQALKGAPASVLLALALAGRSLSYGTDRPGSVVSMCRDPTREPR